MPAHDLPSALGTIGGVRSGGGAPLAFNGSDDGAWTNVYRSINDHQYIAVSKSPEACSQLLLTSNCLRGPPKLWECIQELNSRHAISHGMPIGLPHPRAYALYANAQVRVPPAVASSPVRVARAGRCGAVAGGGRCGWLGFVRGSPAVPSG